MTLKDQTISALLWTLVDKVGTQIAYFITGVIMADLLDVSDFGLIGMLSIFVLLTTIFIDGGFTSALIRYQDTNEDDYSTVFYVNMGMSILLYALLYMSAPLIAEYYDQPRLIPVSRVLFLSILFNSGGIIQNTIYAKSINFKIQTIANIVSLVLSGGIALLLAWKGYGVWAIVYQTVSVSILKTGLLWSVSKWRPRLVFKISTIRRLFGFSSYLLLSQLVGIVQNMYSMMLGKHFSVTTVGYYTQAQKMSDMAISTINSPIQSSLFPVLSSINQEEDRLLNAFRKSMHFACFLSFLFLPMLAITSKPFILMFLRNKWFDSIVFLQILSICGILSIITALVNTFLRVEGKSKHLLFVETIKAVITFSVLIATIPYGAIAVVIGQLISRFLICLFSMYMTALKTNYSMIFQLKDIQSYIFIALASFLVCYPVSYVITNIYLLFLIQNVVYLIAFASLNYLNKNVIIADIIDLVKNKIKK